MKFETLMCALCYELTDLYSAEKQLLTALPKMASAASSPELKEAFAMHLDETQIQVTRLEKVFKLIDMPAKAETCEAMQGLIAEGEEVISAGGNPKVIDALLIGAAQRVEHYEMAGYGTARAFAVNLGLDEVADILQETLDEEGAANKKLTSVAEGGWLSPGVNDSAPAPARM